MQEVCLRLMGKKLLVALAMEGKFASGGLQAIDGDDDMLTAMARELVENKGIGESADGVWRALGQLRPSTSAAVDQEPVEWPIEQPVIDAPTMPIAIESIPSFFVFCAEGILVFFQFFACPDSSQPLWL